MTEVQRGGLADMVIENVAACLTMAERRLRRQIMAAVITAGGPLSAADFAKESGMTVTEAQDGLNCLVAKKRVVLDEAGRVIFVYPVSALATSHQVTLADGRVFNAMCALMHRSHVCARTGYHGDIFVQLVPGTGNFGDCSGRNCGDYPRPISV